MDFDAKIPEILRKQSNLLIDVVMIYFYSKQSRIKSEAKTPEMVCKQSNLCINGCIYDLQIW